MWFPAVLSLDWSLAHLLADWFSSYLSLALLSLGRSSSYLFLKCLRRLLFFGFSSYLSSPRLFFLDFFSSYLSSPGLLFLGWFSSYICRFLSSSSWTGFHHTCHLLSSPYRTGSHHTCRHLGSSSSICSHQASSLRLGLASSLAFSLFLANLRLNQFLLLSLLTFTLKVG